MGGFLLFSLHKCFFSALFQICGRKKSGFMESLPNHQTLSIVQGFLTLFSIYRVFVSINSLSGCELRNWMVSGKEQSYFHGPG